MKPDDVKNKPDEGHQAQDDTGLPSSSTTRRAFLQRTAALSLLLPSLGAALTSCDESSPSSQTAGGKTAGGAGDHHELQHNPDSSLDKAHPIREKSIASGAFDAKSAKYQIFDPTLGPPPVDGVLNLDWRAVEAPVRILPNTVVGAWTFEGNVPSPIIHCRVGDTVNFKLTNDTNMPHSMDFHAAQIDPKVAFRSISKGESLSFSFKPRYAGAFLYHCGTAPVLMHLGTGMYGALIVSPRKPLAPAKEFVLLQSEFYLDKPDRSGIRPFDYQKMLQASQPDYLAFNGRPDQYSQEPIRVKKGDRVRFWVVNAGPTMPCVFHVVGEQFETVYLGEPPDNAIHGVQSYSVGAGGGMVFELVCDIPGDFVFVNHAFGHGQKGAIGHLIVEE